MKDIDARGRDLTLLDDNGSGETRYVSNGKQLNYVFHERSC